jgi:hypothetical protein
MPINRNRAPNTAGEPRVGVRVPVASRMLSSPRRPDRFWSPLKPPIQCVKGSLFPAVKRPGREADHSPPTNAKVKKM